TERAPQPVQGDVEGVLHLHCGRVRPESETRLLPREAVRAAEQQEQQLARLARAEGVSGQRLTAHAHLERAECAHVEVGRSRAGRAGRAAFAVYRAVR